MDIMNDFRIPKKCIRTFKIIFLKAVYGKITRTRERSHFTAINLQIFGPTVLKHDLHFSKQLWEKHFIYLLCVWIFKKTFNFSDLNLFMHYKIWFEFYDLDFL